MMFCIINPVPSVWVVFVIVIVLLFDIPLIVI